MSKHSSVDRRSFLFGATTTPFALAALRRDDSDDMAAFGRLLGLTFDDDEREQAEGLLQGLRRDYRQLRRRETPFELPPIAAFDPRDPRAESPEPTPRNRVDIPASAAKPANEHDLMFAPLLDLASLMRQGKVTARKLVELSLARLAKFDAELFCVVNLLRDSALQRADELDTELANGNDRGPLHGIPFGAKDLFAWPGAPTTFGAKPFADQEWAVKATCLERLHDAGAIPVAKLSLGALAMGDLWHGGRTRNPYRPQQGSSGSSAGSASAVAAGLVPFAIGTETLGSIVSPCVRCGIGGLRPTFGAVSRHGAMPLSWTMDKAGPIARHAEDLALVFDAMRGRDGLDPSARDVPFAWQPDQDIDGLRFGIVDRRRWPKGDAATFVEWVTAQSKAPAKFELPDAPYNALLLMLNVEAAAAFDDFTRAGLLDQLPGQGGNDWPNLFRSARTIPGVEYVQASRQRSQLIADMHAAMQDIDVLIAPTHGPLLTATNLTGHPTLVLPVGKSTRERDDGKPAMIALVGRIDGEGALLRVAQTWQRSTEWHRARPTLSNR